MENKEGFLSISEAPFLRILLPFLTGIILQYTVGGYYLPIISGAFAIYFTIRYYSARTPRTKFSRTKNFGYAVFAVFMLFGTVEMFLLAHRESATPPQYVKTAIARVTNDIEIKDHVISCKAEVLCFNNNRGGSETTGMPIILYLYPDKNAKQLIKGNIIIFRQHLQPIKSRQNPESYDHASAMRHKGFIYSQYLSSNGWKRIGYKEPEGIRDKALLIRAEIISQINSSSLSCDSKNLLKAILAGDTSGVTTEMRASYSTAGLSHILAVSGLHVGIIAIIIYLILSPLKYIGLKRFRPFITIVAIIGYVFITGMSPSAIRAGIMAIFVLAGELFGRKGRTVNSLMAAAFFMILYNPYYIFNISFQLSFTAVFAIFYLYPLIFGVLPQNRRITYHISSVIAVTVAAQIGTLPLTVYYFHQIPLLGIFSNLIVIPLLPYVIFMAIITLILQYQFMENILNLSLNGINTIAENISSLPLSSLQNIYMSPQYMIFWFIVIFTAFWAIRTKRSEIIVAILAFSLIFIAVDKLTDKKNYENTLVIYDDNHLTAINLVSQRYNYVITPDTVRADSAVNVTAQNFWMKNAMPEAKFIKDSICSDGLRITLPYIIFNGNKILVLNSDIFDGKVSHKKLYIHKVIICRGFSGNISQMLALFVFGEVIISSDVNHFKRKTIIKECEVLDIPCHDIKSQGAYIMEW
ncbi:MAG: ComEC/Rec2 family competence protein [Bacteroidales bacterium]